ncbi:unnamed protein product [Notodromas monacha]|uniref:Trans-1,2-dihydrobenzene-1,2-diol dehydrogenase n=1 Tax=Notodromas monacha TaxID=399045 RepID=A0A7R9GE97_9CRUS|nr:unnamed protein product [Notodromas monacha]CAG0917648.1 unnamed protein product [Notodromas monacha]
MRNWGDIRVDFRRVKLRERHCFTFCINFLRLRRRFTKKEKGPVFYFCNIRKGKRKMPLKWGIVSCGKIAADFVCALRTIDGDEHHVVAVAARHQDHAQAFAEKFRVAKAYDSYEKLAEDPNVDVAYIASINPMHFPLAKLMIESKKNVLCEKPMCMNYKETEELIALARQHNVFLMEAIWSRFNPAYLKLKQEIEKGTIGEVLSVYSTLGMPIANVPRLMSKALGGGAMLDIGVYNVHIATWVFGTSMPRVASVGYLNDEGVDRSSSMTLLYPDGKFASSVTHTEVEFPNEAYIIGTKGFLRLPKPFWCATELVTPYKRFSFPVKESECHFPSGYLLRYEAIEVKKCIDEGLKESPLLTLDESLLIAKIMEESRKQMGVLSAKTNFPMDPDPVPSIGRVDEIGDDLERIGDDPNAGLFDDKDEMLRFVQSPGVERELDDDDRNSRIPGAHSICNLSQLSKCLQHSGNQNDDALANDIDIKSGNTDSEESDDDDDDDVQGSKIEGSYNPAEYENLPVSGEIKSLFQYIMRYTPQTIELDHRLKPFIPDYIPAVGDIDAFIKIPKPMGGVQAKANTIADGGTLGLTCLDEPAAKQSDPTVLDLTLRAVVKQTSAKAVAVKTVEEAEKNAKSIEKWIKDISDLHRSKPPPTVHYSKPMPDIDTLMQEWPADFEEALREVGIPNAELECTLQEYTDLTCGLLDIPVYKSRIQSLHVLFTLFSAFKQSQHFQAFNKQPGESVGIEPDRLVFE